MRNEFLPSAREAAATKKKIDRINDEVTRLTQQAEEIKQAEAAIREKLEEMELRGPDDKLDEHLLPQLDIIKNKLYYHDIDDAIDVLTFGYEIDTSIEEGTSIGELTSIIADNLANIAKTILRKDFPNISRDEIKLVVGRTIDLLYTHKILFIDAFTAAIEERREIMQNLPNTTFLIDGKTGIAEPKKNSPS